MSRLNAYYEKARELVAEMTTFEKASLVSGFSMWETRNVERLGIHKADISDGPTGIRKQLDYYDIATDESVQTVCYPTECCAASSWDRELLRKMGIALGKTSKIHDISLLLAPGINIKRTLMGEIWEIPQGRAFLSDILEKVKASGKTGDKEGDEEAYLKMVLAMPLKTLILVNLPAEYVDGFIAKLNEDL